MTTPSSSDPAAPEAGVAAVSDGGAPGVVTTSSQRTSGQGAASTPTASQSPPPRRAHGGGNWRSLIISMAIITAIVFAWVALMPRPGKAAYTPVDVAASARYVAQQTSWPIVVPALGPDWVPTSVRFGKDASGPQSWHIGYNVTSQDTVYVGVEQARRTGDAASDQAWIDAQVKNGAPAGEVTVNGQRWQRYVLGSQTPRESLVRRDVDGLMVVVTGLGGTHWLEQVAASLKPYGAAGGVSGGTSAPVATAGSQ